MIAIDSLRELQGFATNLIILILNHVIEQDIS